MPITFCRLKLHCINFTVSALVETGTGLVLSITNGFTATPNQSYANFSFIPDERLVMD